MELPGVKEIEFVFYDAALSSYASKERPSKTRFAGKQWRSRTTYERDGLWFVVDERNTIDGSDYSWGSTLITYFNQPVWTMQYFGSYQEIAIPCLKAALKHQYEKRKFFGGRGPLTGFEREGFIYKNEPGPRSTFESFHGREIVASEDEIFGEHLYQGGILFNL